MPPEYLTLPWTSTASPGLASESFGVWCTQLSNHTHTQISKKGFAHESIAGGAHSLPETIKANFFEINRSLFLSCFNSLHYLATYPSCPEAYFHVWSFLSLWDLLWCCQQLHALRVPDHLFSASQPFSASAIVACPLLPENRCGFPLGPAGPLASIFSAKLRVTTPFPQLKSWLLLLIFYSVLFVLAEVALSYWPSSLIF